MQLDQVLSLPARAVERVIDVLGRALGQGSDHIADIHAQRAGLDPGDNAALAVPALRAVAGLGITAQDHPAFLGTLDRTGIGGSDDRRIGAQRGVGRQAEHIIDAGRLAEHHDLRAAIMPVAADSDVGIGPVAADVPHQTPDMPRCLLARRRLAGAQQHRHRSAGYRVINMDRQEAALPMMSVPEGELLIAMHDVAGVVDIQRHRHRSSGIAVALMGRNHPIGIIIAALLFGILYQGGMDLAFEMQSVSRHIIVVMQGLVILFCGGLEYLYRPILIRFLAPIEASE